VRVVSQAAALVAVCIAYMCRKLPRAVGAGANDDEDYSIFVPRVVVDLES
jgi:hypothetical protein